MNDSPRPKRFSMLRTFVLADLVTMANAESGTGALFLCLRYVADRDPAYALGAFALLPLALLFDVAHGAIARWRRTQSPLGADLDSLADVVSFGVAPATLGFALGLDGFFDALVLVYFVACGISRLARYNVTSSALADESGKVKYYEGTPIPTSLALVAILGVAWWAGAVHDALWLGELALGGLRFHPLVLIYAVSGSAMISASLRIPKP